MSSFEVRAKVVILAGGAIQSPVFLQNNGLGNEHVGEHLHVHPGVGALGITDQQIQGWRGVPQGWYSDEFIDDKMMLESFWVTPEVYYMSFPFGSEGTDALLDLRSMVALGGVIADASEGTVRPGSEPGKARVSYDLLDEDKNRLVRLQRRVTELMLAGGAREVRTAFFGVPPITSMDEARRLLDESRILVKHLGNVYSSHPQGSVRMGSDPQVSAVDSRGKLHGHEGLYVMDASIFPDVLGVNPQVTIIALSLMLSERLAADLG